MVNSNPEENKLKDIEFHIAMVEQFHQKILEEYEKLENEMLMEQQPNQINT